MFDKNRLKAKLISAFNEQAEEADADAAIGRIVDKMAAAFIEEMKEMKFTYVTGLVAGTVPVTGVIQYNVT